MSACCTPKAIWNLPLPALKPVGLLEILKGFYISVVLFDTYWNSVLSVQSGITPYTKYTRTNI